MEDIVDKQLIRKYAERNTSPKMPIEAKFVNAFLDALLNSKSVKELYEILKDEMQNGDAFILFNSLGFNARNLNREPYRSIIAYSMLKKDIRLFELISASLFTGSVVEYHGKDLYLDTTFNLDENPTKYTDSGLYTDMVIGLIQIGFKNYYCNTPAADGSGSEYQTSDELNKAISDFDYLITLTKPARVGIFLFNVPYCYLTGTKDSIDSCGIDTEYPKFQCPFGDESSMEILENVSDTDLIQMYEEVSMSYTTNEGSELSRPIEYTKKIIPGDGFITMSYDIRCQATVVTETYQHVNSDNEVVEESEERSLIWSDILIKSSNTNKLYVWEKEYNELNKDLYFEKYNPVALRISDDPDADCVAYKVENNLGTELAMFYSRDKL